MGKSEKTGRKVLIRTFSAGVHYGTLVEKNGEEVTLADAKRIWNWQGRNTLNEIALHGVGKKSRVSEAVPRIELLQAIEIIDCSPDAVDNLEGAKWDA
jgi:hypothetical protein